MSETDASLTWALGETQTGMEWQGSRQVRAVQNHETADNYASMEEQKRGRVCFSALVTQVRLTRKGERKKGNYPPDESERERHNKCKTKETAIHLLDWRIQARKQQG